MTWTYATADEIKRVTDKAILAAIADSDGEVRDYWLPKSQLEEPDKFEEGDRDITIGMTEWIANEKEIEGEK